jgi:polyisoprenoid-binding protein YceI
MMTNRGRVLSVMVVALTLGAWTYAAAPLKLTPDSKLWVDGTSTVRSWTCKAGVVDALVETAVENAVPAVLGGENAVKAVTFTVPTDKMDCGNGTMNGHMWKAIKSKDFPTITFQLGTYTIAKATDSSKAMLNGTLTIGGVTKPITMETKLSSTETGGMRVAGTYELNMKDYDLKPPTLMLGTMKVGEKVKVGFDLVLK